MWDMGSGLLYATGGLALSDIWLKASGTRDEHFLWGGVVGAGFEAKITKLMVCELASVGSSNTTYTLASLSSSPIITCTCL